MSDPVVHLIALDAAPLRVGESLTKECPFCTREQKFSITRKSDGVLYNCYVCRSAGFVPDNGAPAGNTAGARQKPRKRYIGEYYPARGVDYEYFENRFGVKLRAHLRGTLHYWQIFVTHRDEYLFPIFDKDGVRVGEVVRQPIWSGDPEPPRRGVPGKAKAITYIEPGSDRQSWFHGKKDMIVLVEDHVSAAKVQQATGYTAVALLGNSISNDAILRIATLNPIRLVWWLDEDMAEQAYTLNRRYGAYFNDSRVVVTADDPKDLSSGSIREVLFD